MIKDAWRKHGFQLVVFALAVLPFFLVLCYATGERVLGVEPNFADIALFQSAVGIIGVSIPPLLHRGLGWRVSLPLLLLYDSFILGTVLFGEIFGFYYRFALWDDAFHFLSAYLLGTLGFFFAGGEEGGKLYSRLAFSLCFALTVGALWEIVEYFSDGVFLTNMQKYALPEDGALEPLIGRAALSDTMRDLIIDFSGAAFFTLCRFLTRRRCRTRARILSIERSDT